MFQKKYSQRILEVLSSISDANYTEVASHIGEPWIISSLLELEHLSLIERTPEKTLRITQRGREILASLDEPQTLDAYNIEQHGLYPW